MEKILTTKTTNIEALSEMERQSLNALPVVDEDKNLKGIVEREKIISRLMISLTQ